MAYIQMYAVAPEFEFPARFTLYKNDEDKIPTEKYRVILREITEMAESHNALVTITSICHHHIEVDGETCECHLFAECVSNAAIDGRNRKG